VAGMQKQVQGREARAACAEQAVAALQQDVASWQARYKKKDAELASQAAKVVTQHSQARCMLLPTVSAFCRGREFCSCLFVRRTS